MRIKGVVGLVIFIVGVFVTLFVIRKDRVSTISNNLSDRAKEFIVKERSDGTGLWNEVIISQQSKDIHDLENSLTRVNTECGQFDIPLRVIRQETKKMGMDCVWTAMTEDKSSHVAVQIRQASSFSDDGSFLLRKKLPTKYREIHLSTSNDMDGTVFISNEDATLFFHDQTVLFIVSFTPSFETQEYQMNIFESMILSVDFLPMRSE